MNSFHNPLPGVPDIESPLFDAIFRAKELPSQTLEIANKLRTDGFAIFDFPEPDFEALSEAIIRKLDEQCQWKAGKTPSMRIQDAWRTVSEVKQLACNPIVIKLLTDLYGRRAFPFQTLNFPVGSQQHYHSDSVHFSSCPERFMAGVWVALEDIDSDNGPLLYYPGSHKLPIFTNEHLGVPPDTLGPSPYGYYKAYEKAWESIVEALDLKPLYFHAKKGQALIWAANLLHGGAPHKDWNRTRNSQVTHYYFEGCSYYTPLSTLPFLGPIHFRDVQDISTGQFIAPQVNGLPVRFGQILSSIPNRYILTNGHSQKIPVPGLNRLTAKLTVQWLRRITASVLS